MVPECVEDAAENPDVLTAHPDYREAAEREARKAIREATGTGHRLHCGGCNRFIRATNTACGCGFQNDIRGRRNHGRWAEGSSFCAEFVADADKSREWGF
jgi:hypothetical protein